MLLYSFGHSHCHLNYVTHCEVNGRIYKVVYVGVASMRRNVDTHLIYLSGKLFYRLSSQDYMDTTILSGIALEWKWLECSRAGQRASVAWHNTWWPCDYVPFHRFPSSLTKMDNLSSCTTPLALVFRRIQGLVDSLSL